MTDANLGASKASRPIVDGDFIDLAVDVLARPGFMAFARIIGLRLASGDSLFAFWMLEAVGASGESANIIVEGWLSAANRRMPDTVMLLHEENAVRLAHFIGDLQGYDWPFLLKLSARKAAERASK